MRVVNFEMYDTIYEKASYRVSDFGGLVRRPYRIIYPDDRPTLQRAYRHDAVDPSILYYETVIEIDPNLFPVFVLDLCLFTLDVKVSDFKRISEYHYALTITDSYDIVYRSRLTPQAVYEKFSNLTRPIGMYSFSFFLIDIWSSHSIWQSIHIPYEDNHVKVNTHGRDKWFPGFLATLIERYGIRKQNNTRTHLRDET